MVLTCRVTLRKPGGVPEPDGRRGRHWPKPRTRRELMRSTDLSWDEQTRADGGRLWAGGAATALVAAGVALVGVLVLHKLLHAAVLAPGGTREAADYAMVVFPISAALVTLLATGLLHLLMTTTPRAPEFFGW